MFGWCNSKEKWDSYIYIKRRNGSLEIEVYKSFVFFMGVRVWWQEKWKFREPTPGNHFTEEG
jgi:hypothetical protein